MSKYIFCCVVALVLIYASFCVAITDPCDQSGALDAGSFSNLVTVLTNIPNIIDRYDALVDFATGNLTSGFSANQSVTLAGLFGNELYVKQMYSDLNIYFLGMKCSDVIAILQTVSNELLRLDILPSVAALTFDLRANGDSIVQIFQNTFNQQDAAAIINGTAQLSCIWGPITSKRLVFVVDVSGSMGTTFVNPQDGQTYTRLQYVKTDLNNVISNVLLSYQEFNVAYFSDKVSIWQNTVQPVNSANVASATSFVNTFVPLGGTDTYDALNAVFADPNVLAVFLLSDGQPNPGQAPNIVQLAQKWSSATPGVSKTVNTVCFQVGGTYDPVATQFMQTLASVTGGVFRSIV